MKLNKILKKDFVCTGHTISKFEIVIANNAKL